MILTRWYLIESIIEKCIIGLAVLINVKINLNWNQVAFCNSNNYSVCFNKTLLETIQTTCKIAKLIKQINWILFHSKYHWLWLSRTVNGKGGEKSAVFNCT